MLAYTTRDDDGRLLSNAICHFFLDDYRFESLWTRPLTGLERVRRFRATLAPDFSLYRDWPLVAQLWNTYRARVVARSWQDQGVIVVPVVNWAGPSSWGWCFDGIQPGGTIALSVPDLRDHATRHLFEQGWNAMLDRLAPALALVYGALPFEDPGVKVREYPPNWLSLRQCRGGRRHTPGDAALPHPEHLEPTFEDHPEPAIAGHPHETR
jgi:hypothetical protein